MLYTVLHNQTRGSRFECIPEDFISGIGRYTVVALVEAESLAQVMELTNAIDSAWTVNPGIVALPNGSAQRSTSVGDVILGPGVASKDTGDFDLSDGPQVWMVDNVGFKQVLFIASKQYRGYHDSAGGEHVIVQTSKDVSLHGEGLDPRHDLYNHSPDGFAWGYGGSGPAQLALAICADLVGDERAQRVYQIFKERMIAPLTQDQGFTLSAEVALQAIENIEQELKKFSEG